MSVSISPAALHRACAAPARRQMSAARAGSGQRERAAAGGGRRAAGGAAAPAPSAAKLLWLSTQSQDALTAALEAGVSTVVFSEEQAALAAEWQQLGRFDALTRSADGRLLDAVGTQVGRVRLLAGPDDLRAAEREAAAAAGTLVMDATDWQARGRVERRRWGQRLLACCRSWPPPQPWWLTPLTPPPLRRPRSSLPRTWWPRRRATPQPRCWRWPPTRRAAG